jgi:hypothetical protein
MRTKILQIILSFILLFYYILIDELFATNFTSGVHFTNGSSNYVSRNYKSEGYTHVTGDFNGDGITDFMWYHFFKNSHDIFLKNVDGTIKYVNFADGMTYDHGYTHITGDFNGDGITDFMWYYGPGNHHYTYLGKGDGTFHKNVYFTDGMGYDKGYQQITGDFNGDGITDFMWYFGQGNHHYTYFGKGDGTFHKYVYFTDGMGYDKGYQQITGDFNGDGITDFMWYYGDSGNHHYTYFGKGDGTFDKNVYFSDGMAYDKGYQQITGDFNGDGMTDFMWYYGDSGNHHYTYFSKGDGTFSKYIYFSDGMAYDKGYLQITGDFNGDGITDFIWYFTVNNSHYTYLGKGDGTFNLNIYFKDSTNYEGYTHSTGNFNSDGMTDFIWYHPNTNVHYTFLSNGKNN